MWLVYESPKPCEYCVKAVELLRRKQLRYHIMSVSSEELKSMIGVGEPLTYPQIFDDEGNRVGGYDKLCDRVDEPLLDVSLSRFSPIPVKKFDIWEMYKKAQAVNWVTEEIDYSLDLHDWEALSHDEQHFLKHVLAFFNGADGIVQENLMMNFVLEVQYAEARQFYVHQAYMESIHSETYGTLLSTYVTDESERDKLMDAIQTTKSVKAKATWAMKWMDASRPFAQRLVAFICVEGIMFSGSFCAIFWMKMRGKLSSMTFSNDFIARDEGMHQQFGELLYNKHLNHKLSPTVIGSIVREAVDAEEQFINEAIPSSLKDPHIDVERMVQYVKYIADRILVTLNYQPMFGEKQPFPWMEGISLRSISNFFEKRSEVYRDARVRLQGDGVVDEPVFGEQDLDF